MKSAFANRAGSAWRPLALASSITVLASSAIAQTDNEQQLAPVTVSASRFESTETPIGATVITAEQIREAGVGNVNEAIRKIGGVFGRQNFTGTSDYSLDLRGFGTNSDQNVAVFVDGIRISENELAPAMMSAIPIESVERIEIVRGGSSVLYGDGATGGTIQIITKRGAKSGTHGSIVTEVGSHGYEEVRASVAKGIDGFSIDANIGSLRTDNYRDNNELRQRNFSGGIQWASADARIGLRIDAARENYGLPGPLTLSQYEQDPRQTTTPFDKGSLDSNRYTFFAQQKYGNLEAAMDLSYREKTSKATFVSFGSTSDADSSVTQFSPRIKYSSSFASVRNEFVIGTDFSDSRRVTEGTSSFGPSSQNATQNSSAIYLRDEVFLNKARIAAGVRHEDFDQAVKGILDKSFSVNAWDLQGSYDLVEEITLFAKVGRSYRIANVDENTLAFIPLKPQTSNDLELGSK
ncbi:MAG TPA: TonB-dependent receptor plug domain-containing protein, partial [Oxalicibacterium sp.]|nr:TonB-dependent receptor plug domain-containing protein [Oxalicibacterium sp.]